MSGVSSSALGKVTAAGFSGRGTEGTMGCCFNGGYDMIRMPARELAEERGIPRGLCHLKLALIV